MNRTHYARRMNGKALHVVVGVHAWASDMTATSECGVKHCVVLADKADRTNPSPETCKRCMHALGWDLTV